MDGSEQNAIRLIAAEIVRKLYVANSVTQLELLESQIKGSLVELRKELVVLDNQKAPWQLVCGELVFATRWPDCDWNDPWCVGYVGEMFEDHVTLTARNGLLIKGFGNMPWVYAMRITEEQGAWIAENYRKMQGQPFDPVFAYRGVNGQLETSCR